ncbi:retrovirus-related pol polyprotein from transposon TNT 1-94 [Tanacetum coccineum]|uniref:Retrovirus-related pol polyprotein from transposon TNT 1-94 n=1 Tax=Tanacetum coccineum TaxID=301880 RepID=A0ABQ5EIP3_9ASTR
MTGAKFDIEKFDGTGDFRLWRIKMRALLIQHGYEAALEVLPVDMEAEAKAELNKKAHSAVILCLGKVKIEVRGEAQVLHLPICGSLEEKRRKNNRKEVNRFVKKDWISQASVSSIYVEFENAMGAVYGWVTTGIVRSEVLARNLISLGTLEKEGYTIKMQSGKVKVINGSRVVLSGTRRTNCVYSLDGHAVAGDLNASVDEKDSLAQVCHKRFGHISEAGLQVLEKQVLFGKESLGKLDFCENCVLGKSHRVRFGVGRHTTQGVIDYVHSDLWGPSQVESLGGKRYFLSIVDDYSRRVWVYILRFKHKAFGKFKEWKQLVENQTGRTVKMCGTDNGLSSVTRKFEELCLESGSPSTAIEKKTPIEMWSGHPSDYEILRIFGCVAYPHDKQGKLEPREIKCVLLGYPKGVKGYRLYRLDGESPNIVYSRNCWSSIEKCHVQSQLRYFGTVRRRISGRSKFNDSETSLQISSHTPLLPPPSVSPSPPLDMDTLVD